MGNVSLKVLERSLTFLFKKGTNPVVTIVIDFNCGVRGLLAIGDKKG